MNLSESQNQAYEAIVASLAKRPKKPIVLSGMSGFGKSKVVARTAMGFGADDIDTSKPNLTRFTRGENPLLDVWEDAEQEPGYKLEPLIRDISARTRKGAQAVIIANNVGRFHKKTHSEDTIPSIPEYLASQNIRYTNIELGPLTPAETEAIIKTHKPEATEQEVAAIKKHSFGIPILVITLAKLEPFNEKEALQLTHVYLGNYFERTFNTPTHIQSTVQAFTGVTLDLEEIRQIGAEKLKRYGGIDDIVFNTMPPTKCLDTISLYRDWAKDLEHSGEIDTDLTIYCPELPPELQQLLEKEWGNIRRTFRAADSFAKYGIEGRKAHAKVGDALLHSSYYDETSRTPRKFSNVFGLVRKEEEIKRRITNQHLGNKTVDLMVSAHDHSGFYLNQTRIGYAHEYWLQEAGVPYFVCYGNLGTAPVYMYDPVANKMVKLQ